MSDIAVIIFGFILISIDKRIFKIGSVNKEISPYSLTNYVTTITQIIAFKHLHYTLYFVDFFLLSICPSKDFLGEIAFGNKAAYCTHLLEL